MKGLFLLFVFFFGITLALNPIVFAPGYSLSVLSVTYEGTPVEGCPESGSFKIGFNEDNTDVACKTKIVKLDYDESTKKWSNLPGVNITIEGRENGSLSCISNDAYKPFFDHLQNELGYNETNLFSACYDWRMTPNEDAIEGPGFLENTKAIVEHAYETNGKKRVYLSAHSNGPLMILYFLHFHVTNEWKDKYIEAFIPICGNFGGQAFFPVAYYTGLSVFDFSFDTTTRDTLLYWPQNYMSFPIKKHFQGENDIVIISLNNGTNYTVSQYKDLFRSSGLEFAAEMSEKYEGTVGPHTPPYVRTFGFYGYHVDTVHGVILNELNQTESPNDDELLLRDGDGNQEDIDNEAFLEWKSTMPEGCFSVDAIFRGDHFALFTTPDSEFFYKFSKIVTGDHPKLDCHERMDDPLEPSTPSSPSNSKRVEITIMTIMISIVSMICYLF